MFQNIFPLSVISKSYSLTKLFFQDKLTGIYFPFHDNAILFFEAGKLLIMIMRPRNDKKEGSSLHQIKGEG